MKRCDKPSIIEKHLIGCFQFQIPFPEFSADVTDTLPLPRFVRLPSQLERNDIFLRMFQQPQINYEPERPALKKTKELCLAGL